MTYNYFVDLSSWFFIIFMLGTIAYNMIDNTLEYLNNRKSDINRKTKEIHGIHPLFKKLYSLPKIKKAIEYHGEHQQLSELSSYISSSFTSTFMIFGITPFIFHMLYTSIGNITLTYIASCLLSSLGMCILHMPFSYYATFHIEDKYGFNKSSKTLFIIDEIKGYIIESALVSAFIYVINTILTSFGRFDAVHICMFVGFLVLIGYVMEFISSTFLIRIFNKLTPLKDKNLKKRITSLFKKCGYSKTPKLFVMDSSRRSSHGNAFICGIGPFKKIVLFDTLLKNHTNDEILSILAHEIGHDKNHDLLKHRLYSIHKTLFLTFVVFYFIYDIRLYHAFGFRFVTEDNVVSFSLLGMTLMNMIISPLKIILFTPYESRLSRKMEYSADEYSAKNTSPKSMISSLIRLSSDNLSDIFPHKLYESWYYDHPSIVNRVNALLNMTKKTKKNNSHNKSKKTNDSTRRH